MCARDVTLRSPPRPPPQGERERRRPSRSARLRTSGAFLKMADGLCTDDAAARRRNNLIQEQQQQQGVNENKKLRGRGGEDKMECGRRTNGFLEVVVGDDDNIDDDDDNNRLCGVDGLCPNNKRVVVEEEEGFLVGEMTAEDDCRKKRCVDRYDSSESSDRYVEFVDIKQKLFRNRVCLLQTVIFNCFNTTWSKS